MFEELVNVVFILCIAVNRAMENDKLVEGGVYNGVEDHQSEEDKKMEEFFSLIRSFHEARNRRRRELTHELEEKTNKKSKIRRFRDEEDQQQSSSWVPSFEWQDFTEDIEFRRPPTIFPSPCNKKELETKTQPRQEDDCLDLKLTL